MAKKKAVKKKKKPVKKRAAKYDPKLAVDASFLDVINASVGRTDLIKKKD
jgi:hypothetical protein